MATEKITQKPVAEEIDENATILIVQPGDDTDIDKLYRASIDDLKKMIQKEQTSVEVVIF